MVPVSEVEETKGVKVGKYMDSSVLQYVLLLGI